MPDNVKSGIPTKELALPNGETVVFYEYLTTKESRELSRLIMEKGKFNIDTGKMESFDLTAVLDQQDKAAVFAIKEIKGKDGTVKPFIQEWLDNLPADSGNKVYEEISKYTKTTQLPVEEKKS